MTRGVSRRSFAAGVGAAVVAAPFVARGQGALTRVRYTMDWAFQGPIAFAILGRDKGFFREAGIDIAFSRGFGGGRVPVDIAAGAYEMGQADINPALKFMAENPDRGLVVIAITSDRSPQLVVSHADGPVKMPKDLEGRTLAAPEFDAARQMFPAFARTAGSTQARSSGSRSSPSCGSHCWSKSGQMRSPASSPARGFRSRRLAWTGRNSGTCSTATTVSIFIPTASSRRGTTCSGNRTRPAQPCAQCSAA